MINDTEGEVGTSTLDVEFTVLATFVCEGDTPTSSISGTVSSYGNENDDVTVELYIDRKDTPEYSTAIKGNDASYCFEGVTEGEYILKVSKNNHASAEYSISVFGNNVIQNVQFWIKGDVTGDGEVDSTDYLRIKGQFLGKYTLEGIAFEAGEVTNDGEIDSTDYLKIKSHFLGTYNLYK